MHKNKLFLLFFGLLLFVPFAHPVLAAKIENLTNTPVAGDYVIGPGKTELALDPGGQITKILTVTNRYGKDMDFSIEIEDFSGSNNLDQPLVLLGQEKGPYSLKDFLHPEMITFTLHHGDRISIPILVNIPKDAQPGGLYGSVIVSTKPTDDETVSDASHAQGNITIISRLASLFFVRVNGPVHESGQILNFFSDKKVYTQPTIIFKELFQNTGNIYLNPYGLLRVENIIGTPIDQEKIEPYFVMPDSVRQKEITISRPIMLGRYKATLQLNRGYGNLVDERSIYFWVLPWKLIGGLVVVVFFIIFVLKSSLAWFKNNFEIKRKQ